MSRRRDAAAFVIEFFEQQPVDAAVAVLGICTSIVKRRKKGTPGVSTPAPSTPADGLTPAQGAGFSSDT